MNEVDIKVLLVKYMALVIGEESVSYLEMVPYATAVHFSGVELSFLREIEKEALNIFGADGLA